MDFLRSPDYSALFPSELQKDNVNARLGLRVLVPKCISARSEARASIYSEGPYYMHMGFAPYTLACMHGSHVALRLRLLSDFWVATGSKPKTDRVATKVPSPPINSAGELGPHLISLKLSRLL